MDNNQIFALLPDAILPWYWDHHRELPWRQDKGPYHIWVSEIMLQQTRVEAVRGYYARFLEALPTTRDLANAPEELLYKLWEGLGYYSRVRNLKKAAICVMEDHGGVFPVDHKSVLNLPGIGPYTAGAICSIAYDLPTPAVDGNVLRVVSRLTDDDTPVDSAQYKKTVESALKEVYPKQAGDFTQALMELGATVCGPNRAPQCVQCPCCEFCKGYLRGTAERLPVKNPKVTRREEDRTVFIINCEDHYCMEKRPNKGLLAGLWQFPNVSGKLDINQALNWVEAMGMQPSQIIKTVERKHIFTHIQWNMQGIYLTVKDRIPGRIWLSREEINSDAALPTAFRQFWEENAL